MLTVKEVKDNELLPENLISTLNEKCECGGEILISESLSEVQCSNPNCIFKVTSRTKRFLEYLGLNNWIQLDIEQAVRKFNIVTPYQFMILNDLTNELKSIVSGATKKIEDINKVKDKKFHLWQIVKYADIPYISSIAYELFGSYDSVEKAYNDIEAEQVSFLVEKLGINSNEPSVIALLVYNKLLEVKDELLFGELQFNIIKYSVNPLKIVISTDIEGFVNKYEYMEYLNTRYKDQVSFVLESKISSNTVVLINERSFDSLKYRTAKRINEEYVKESVESNLFKYSDVGRQRSDGELLKVGEKIAIISGQELVERLDKLIEVEGDNLNYKLNNLVLTGNMHNSGLGIADSLEDDLDDLTDEELEEIYNSSKEELEDNNEDIYDLDDLDDEELAEYLNDDLEED